MPLDEEVPEIEETDDGPDETDDENDIQATDDETEEQDEVEDPKHIIYGCYYVSVHRYHKIHVRQAEIPQIRRKLLGK